MAIDITTGTFESGKKWVAFEEIGAAGTQTLVSRDSTTVIQRFYIEKVYLSCATGSSVGIFDGSATAASIFRVDSGGDVTIGTQTQGWDFDRDAWKGNTIDATATLCISSTGNISGFVKYSIGN